MRARPCIAFGLALAAAGSFGATVTETKLSFPAYPYGDPDPVPATSKIHWRQRDLGTYGAEYACDVPPLATQLVRLFPEPGAGLRKGLTDIRMNGFYRLLETKRPVGRPGYEPPKGWPCKDCL